MPPSNAFAGAASTLGFHSDPAISERIGTQAIANENIFSLRIHLVAKDAGISQPTLQLLVTGKRSISAETALRLGLFFGIDAQFWMNLQSEYDLRLAKERLASLEKEVHPLPKAA